MRAPLLLPSLAILALAAASPLAAQVARVELEVAADSVRLPIFVNGRTVGITAATPTLVTLAAGTGLRVEVGRPGRARAVTLDMPNGGRARLDVTMLRDTAGVPVARTVEQLTRDLQFASRFPVPVAPVYPRKPTAPGFLGSTLGGIAVGAATVAVSTALCEQTFTAPEPSGWYVGGTYYAPGTYSLGTSSACVAMAGGGGLLVGTIGFHQFRKLRFRRALAAFGPAETQFQLQTLQYRERVTRREAEMRAELERAQAADVARQREVAAANVATLRSNAELPLVTFINAPGAKATGARTMLLTPTLQIVAMAFADTDGDSVVSAGERATLTVDLENLGRGAAFDVQLVARVDSGEIRSEPVAVGTLGPGERRAVTIAFEAAREVRDGVARLQVEAVEKRGFDADPFLVRVATQAYRAPVLSIAEVGVEDTLGRAIIAPNMPATVTVRVQNRGGRADAVQVVFDRGDSTILFVEDYESSRLTREVGRLRPGEFRDVSVMVIPNRRARGVPLRAQVIDASGVGGSAMQSLGLQLNREQPKLTQLDVDRGAAATTGAGALMVGPALGSTLLANIPLAKVRNPDAVAVIIGNRDYRQAPRVDYAANDAAVMRKYAEDALGIPSENVVVMQNATKSALEVMFGVAGNANGDLRRLVRPGRTEVFVFYSGHGAPDPVAERAYLMPSDADANRISLTGYGLDQLYANLAALGAKHVTVVLDACFTGAAGSGQLVTMASPIGIRVTDPSAQFAGGSATVVTAASSQQLANWYPEQRHGMLTYFFLKGLQGAADDDRDGAVTVGEMRRYLTDPVTGLPFEANRVHGRPQMPQVYGVEARVIRR